MSKSIDMSFYEFKTLTTYILIVTFVKLDIDDINNCCFRWQLFDRDAGGVDRCILSIYQSK